jgi:hypothetical protein
VLVRCAKVRSSLLCAQCALVTNPYPHGSGCILKLAKALFVIRFSHKLDPISPFPFVGIYNSVKYESSLHYGIIGSLICLVCVDFRETVVLFEELSDIFSGENNQINSRELLMKVSHMISLWVCAY